MIITICKLIPTLLKNKSSSCSLYSSMKDLIKNYLILYSTLHMQTTRAIDKKINVFFYFENELIKL